MNTPEFHTPILLLVFNRPEPTKMVFELVRKVKPKFLYVSADGPRPGNAKDIEGCKRTREIFKNIDWDCQLKTRFLEENLGCRYGVSSGITWFFENVEEGIILEDDCLVDETFFPFAASLLEKYRDNQKVMHISASNFYGRYEMEESYYFSLYNHIWGWASWKRAWLPNYQVDLKHIPKKEFRQIVHRLFSRSIDRRFWMDMFYYAKSGNINTWDYQWMFSMWKADGLGVTPKANMVSNIGFGEGATNTQINNEDFSKQIAYPISFPLKHPAVIEADAAKDAFASDYLFKIKQLARWFNLKIKVAGCMPVGLKNWIKKLV